VDEGPHIVCHERGLVSAGKPLERESAMLKGDLDAIVA
jgi:hypothetical protein